MAFALLSSVGNGAGGVTGSVTAVCGDPVEPNEIACADLALSPLTVSASADGRSAVLAATVSNRGNAAAPSTLVLASVTGSKPVRSKIRSLKVGAQTTVTLSVQLPDPSVDLTVTAQGRRPPTATLHVDPAKRIQEPDDDNNVSSRHLLADLALEPVEASLANRDAVTVAFTVVNRGLTAAARSWVGVRGGDVSKALRLGALARGAAATGTATLEVTAGMRGRTVGFSVRADVRRTIREVNEKNNIGRKSLAIPPALPDLRVQHASAKLSDSAASALVEVSVENVGTKAARESALRVSAVGWQPDRVTVPGIEPGTSQSVTARLAVPDAARGGRTGFAVKADADEKVEEEDEANNAGRATLDVPALQSNLAIVTVAPRLSHDGRRVFLTTVVRNTGDGAAGASELSAVSPGWLRRTASVRALDPGESATVSLELAVPDAKRGRRSTFSLDADAEEAVDESDETDNGGEATVFVPSSGVRLPDLALATITSAAGEDEIVLTVDVHNGGNASAAQTQVAATAGTRSHRVSLSELAPGADDRVELRLPIDDDDRGRRLDVTVEVDPAGAIREHDEDNNRRAVTITVPAGKPNLTVGFGSIDLSADEERLLIDLEVENRGRGPAPKTLARVSAPGWAKRSARVPPLLAGAERTLRLELPVRDELRGHKHTLVAEIDPARIIDESNEDDNRDSHTTILPAAAPDLAAVIVGKPAVHEGRVVVTVRILNIGEGRVGETSVEAGGRSLQAADGRVGALAPGETDDVILELEIGDELRGGTAFVSAQVDPANAVLEASEDNNRTRLVSVKVPDGFPFMLVISLGVLGTVGLAVGRGVLRLRWRRAWERRAVESEEPEECRAPGKWCRKLVVAPKRWIHRKVARFDLAMNGGKPRSRKVEGELVKAVNRAVRRYRRARDAEALRDDLRPVASGLVDEIALWLRNDADAHDVALACHVAGGKVNVKYQLYKCVDGKPKKVKEWSRALEDESDEDVAVVPFPYDDEPDRLRRVDALVGELTAFCSARVDIPPEGGPEAAPVPHH